MNTPLITLTGNPDSTLAKTSTVNIDVSVKKEACPLGLAPTSSTTATLAMGDAIAIALLESRGFSEDDFALSHPGGTLGRRLLLLVDDIMHTGEEIPKVNENATLSEALVEMSEKGISVNAVSPGFIKTKALNAFPKDLSIQELASRNTPAGRSVTGKDVGNVVSMLCGKDAEMIRGQIITVDGGETILFR